jgi:hypothetical protein
VIVLIGGPGRERDHSVLLGPGPVGNGDGPGGQRVFGPDMQRDCAGPIVVMATACGTLGCTHTHLADIVGVTAGMRTCVKIN